MPLLVMAHITAFGAKGLYSEHYANENNDYQEDTHKGTFDSNGNLRLQW